MYSSKTESKFIKKLNNWNIFVITITVLVLPGILLSCANNNEGAKTTVVYGILEGIVTINPIWPIEQLGVNSIVPADVFQERNIWIYNKNLTKRITTAHINQIGQTNQGFFNIELQPGTYMVDINYHGIDTSNDVPEFVDIIENQMTSISINIDTGIR